MSHMFQFGKHIVVVKTPKLPSWFKPERLDLGLAGVGFILILLGWLVWP